MERLGRDVRALLAMLFLFNVSRLVLTPGQSPNASPDEEN